MQCILHGLFEFYTPQYFLPPMAVMAADIAIFRQKKTPNLSPKLIFIGLANCSIMLSFN